MSKGKMEEIRFLADVNVEKPVVDYLLKEGYDIEWIPDIEIGMSDEGLLQIANREKRILITNDKDFGELIFLQKRLTSGIILIRAKGLRSREKVRLMKKLLMGYREKLLNHFVVLTKNKIRVIPVGDKK
jgi:predicted nuclease of predicted toxin-antitoxin system